MNYYALTAFFNGLFGLFAVYYVLLRNSRNLLNQTFSLFGLSVAGWSLIYALWCWEDNAFDAERYVRTHMAFCSLIPATFFHFSCVFTKNEHTLKGWIIFNYSLNVVFAFLFQTPLMISGVKQILIFPYWPMPGILTPYFVAYFSYLVLYCFYLMTRYALSVTGIEKRQTVIALVGFVVCFGGGWTNWFLWFDVLIAPATNFFVGLLFATMLYVMVRYGVMDRDMLVELVRSNRLTHMGLLMAGINHEIKSPLYVIRGIADAKLTSESNASEELKEMCQKTCQQIDRVNSIMQKFSSLVRSPSISSSSASSVIVPDILKNVEALVAPQFTIDRIKITFNVPDDLPAISMDGTHLEEVVLNLVMNASQAIKEKGLSVGESPYRGVITVQARLNDQYVEICVEDNGAGFKDLKRLFEVFSTTKAEGTGLGLYITKQLVEKYKGKIDVRSEKGQGSVVTVKLLAESAVKA